MYAEVIRPVPTEGKWGVMENRDYYCFSIKIRNIHSSCATAGYESANDLHNNFSTGINEVVDGRDGVTPGPKDGIAVGILFVLGFGCANGPEGGTESL